MPIEDTLRLKLASKAAGELPTNQRHGRTALRRNIAPATVVAVLSPLALKVGALGSVGPNVRCRKRSGNNDGALWELSLNIRCISSFT